RAVLGRRVSDRQSHFRLRLGPLSYAQCQRFLPGQPARGALRDWLQQHLGLRPSCGTRLVRQGSEVPRLQVAPLRQGGQAATRAPARRGLSAWLGSKGPHPDRADLRLRLASPRHGTERPEARRSKMAEISRTALFGKLNPLAYKAIEG